MCISDPPLRIVYFPSLPYPLPQPVIILQAVLLDAKELEEIVANP
jgi:hypothetical protein